MDDEYTIAKLDTSRTAAVSIKRAPVLDGSTVGALLQALGARSALVLLSPTVDRLFGRDIRATVRGIGLSASHVQVVPTGEANELLDTVAEVLRVARGLALSRDAVLVGVGGGILLDIVGFAASLFRRGIGHIKIGTTLVAQVDAAVGIKCGVNLGTAKNLVGAFYPPEQVLTDGRFLSTLGIHDVRCGLVEMIKLGAIVDAQLFEGLERHGAGLLDPAARDCDTSRWLVDRSVSSMVAELASNPYENDRRRRVDFGHTVSPYLEAETGYGMRHGEAVAVDLALFLVVSNLMNLLPSAVLDRILSLLQNLSIPIWYDLLLDSAFIDTALTAAEAHRGGRLNLPLVVDIGVATFVEDRADLPPTLIRAAVHQLRRLVR